MHIASVVKLPISTSGSPLLIRCKNFLSVTFVIPKERDSHEMYTSLLKLSQPGGYAFDEFIIFFTIAIYVTCF